MNSVKAVRGIVSFYKEEVKLNPVLNVMYASHCLKHYGSYVFCPKDIEVLSHL
jgi:hypothetical protein